VEEVQLEMGEGEEQEPLPISDTQQETEETGVDEQLNELEIGDGSCEAHGAVEEKDSQGDVEMAEGDRGIGEACEANGERGNQKEQPEAGEGELGDELDIGEGEGWEAHKVVVEETNEEKGEQEKEREGEKSEDCRDQIRADSEPAPPSEATGAASDMGNGGAMRPEDETLDVSESERGDVVSDQESGGGDSGSFTPPEDESPIEKALRLAIKNDPTLKDAFHFLLKAKHHKMDNDYQTIQSYRFAVSVYDRWFNQMIDVEVLITTCDIINSEIHAFLQGDKPQLVQKFHILRTLQYSSPWFTQAKEVVDCLRQLSATVDVEQYKGSKHGGRKLLDILKKKLE
jgi:hypothetical protein